jgi:hypothetical protein
MCQASLYSNTTGSNNVGIGYAALNANTTASNNTAVGYQAGYSNTTGAFNTFVGQGAGYASTGNANTLVGQNAGTATTGTNNAFFGAGAGVAVTSGASNTFLGSGLVGVNGSGSAVTTGSKNSILGNYSGNQGGLDIRTASNYIVLSDGDGNVRQTIDSSGNVLVGTTSASITNGGFWIAPGGGSSSAQIGHASGTASGNVYINFGLDVATIGSITQSGTTAVLYNTTSDYRLKENIQDAASASALIDSLQVRQFDWKTDNTHQRYGFIAQELVTVAPEAVHQPADPEEMMAVDYSKLVPMLVKEIQSLRIRLAALEAA